MALSSAYVDEDFNSTSARSVASVFEAEFGPFDRCKRRVDGDLLVRARETKTWYRVECSPLYDENEALVGYEVEIFPK